MEKSKKATFNWFPGHMKKASIGIEEKLKYVDFVIVILDSRVPSTSFNEFLFSKFKGKKKLYVLTKKDLADDSLTIKWIEKFKKEGNEAIAVNLNDNQGKKEIFEKIIEFCREKEEKYAKKGIKNVCSRAMIVGIPNVGKSTLINYLAPKKLQKSANTPGVTRSLTWFKINKNFELLDTPGILEPKFKDEESGMKLSLSGSIKEGVFPLDDVCKYAINYLRNNYKNEFINKYSLNSIEEMNEGDIYEHIAKLRGLVLKGGVYDIEKAKYLFFKDFKEGKIVKLTLDRDI